MERYPVVVVGGGQAGLAISWHLSSRGIEHVVLERGRIGERWWSERWDSLAFQFPNWALSLPGYDYDGPDPDGFAHYREVAERIGRYAERQAAPVRPHTEVLSAVPRDGGAGWVLTTAEGTLGCDALVAATGPFQRPVIPSLAGDIPASVVQVHSNAYRNPDQLPEGAVLVVGSGGSGAQIAEELLGAGRTVYLSVNRHRRIPRTVAGRDALWWLLELGVMDRTRADWPDGRVPPTVLFTGVDGGHDLDLHRLRAAGAILLGRLSGVEGDTFRFGPDAGAIAADADRSCREFLAAITTKARDIGLDPPDDTVEVTPVPIPVVPTLRRHDVGITSVVWCTGYGLDFDWIRAPLLDDAGEPRQSRGVSAVPGLYLLGLHWMHTFKSGGFFGVGDDAAYLADRIDAALRGRTHV